MESISLPALFIVLLFYLSYRQLVRSSKLPLPPGPSLLNPTTIPQKEVWHTFREWHHRHGPIISLKLGVQTIIVLGNRQIAQDLLDKRGSNYSSRPRSIFTSKYSFKGLEPVLMQYGPEWKLHRQLHTHLLKPQAIRAYQAVQDAHSAELIYNFLSTDDFVSNIHHFASSNASVLGYGRALAQTEGAFKRVDPAIDEAIHSLSIAGVLVDIFPIIDRLPRFLSKWKDAGERFHSTYKQLMMELLRTGLDQDTWSWTQEALKKKTGQELSEVQLAFSIGEVSLAASHTARIVLETFVLICLLHPDAMQKAQKELDSVVGSQRLPTSEDIEALPYFRGFVSEILRWRPALPIGIPHATTEDDEYMGYSIPANSIVIANQWEMDMDPEAFEEPECFKPERWVQNPNLQLAAFGFGRRTCPGRHFALSSLSIAISRILWAYDITLPEGGDLDRTKAADKSGVHGFLYRPTAFEASFHVRSSQHQHVIEQAWLCVNKDPKGMLEEIRNSSAFTPKV